MDTAATLAGLIKAPYSSCWGSLLQDGERAVKASVTASVPWKGELGQQEREMQSFTDLLLRCDLPTKLPRDEGGKDLHKAATISDCFSNKITNASHKSAFPN